MMKQVKLYCTFGNKYEYKQEFESTLAYIAGGYTGTAGVGVYINKNNRVEAEVVTVYEVLCHERYLNQLFDLSKDYGKSCEQESVLMTVHDIDCTFLEKGVDYD